MDERIDTKPAGQLVSTFDQHYLHEAPVYRHSSQQGMRALRPCSLDSVPNMGTSSLTASAANICYTPRRHGQGLERTRSRCFFFLYFYAFMVLRAMQTTVTVKHGDCLISRIHHTMASIACIRDQCFGQEDWHVVQRGCGVCMGKGHLRDRSTKGEIVRPQGVE